MFINQLMPLSRELKNYRRRLNRSAGLHKTKPSPLGEIACLRIHTNPVAESSNLERYCTIQYADSLD